jgi:hypothetical protein
MSEDTVAQKITSLQRCVSHARVALSTARQVIEALRQLTLL